MDPDAGMLSSVFQTTLDIVSDAVLVLSQSLRVLYVNTAFCETTGFELSAMLGRDLLETAYGAQLAEHNGALLQSLHKGQDWQGDVLLRSAWGDEIWHAVRAAAMAGDQEAAYVIVGSDITPRRMQQEEESVLDMGDPSLGVPLILFMDRLHHAIMRADRHRKLVAMAYINLQSDPPRCGLPRESFEQACHELMDRVKSRLRQLDSFVRLDAEEFALILEDFTEASSLSLVLDRVLQELENPFGEVAEEITVTNQIGVALYPMHGLSAEELFDSAKEAMLQSVEHPEQQYLLAKNDMM